MDQTYEDSPFLPEDRERANFRNALFFMMLYFTHTVNKVE